MMGRSGRPRAVGRRRNANGKVRPIKRDDRYEVAKTRIARFGVTERQSVSALSGYLAGVLYLRGDITSEHLGRFYSFLQLMPRGDARAIIVRERVQGGRFQTPLGGSKGFHLLLKHLGRGQVDILRELANDRLICSVDRLRTVLGKVPLTKAGSEFSISCQIQRSRHDPDHATRSTQRQEGQ